MKKKSIIVAIIAAVGVVAFLSWRSLTASTEPFPPAEVCAPGSVVVPDSIHVDSGTGQCHWACRKECSGPSTCNAARTQECVTDDKGKCKCKCVKGNGGEDCVSPCGHIDPGGFVHQ